MNKSIVVGITGCSGSGKTYFLKQLLNYFKRNEICLISQDNYYIPREQQPLDHQGVKNFDTLQSIDLEQFIRDLEQLKQGKKVIRKEYTFNNPAREPGILEFIPAPILVVEGIFILSDKRLSNLIDYKIYIDAKDHIRLKRRIKRDKDERGYDLEDVLYRYQYHVIPSYEHYIEPYKNSADIIIPNDHSFKNALEIAVAFLKMKVA